MVAPTAREEGLGYIDQAKMGRTLDLLKRFYNTMKHLPNIPVPKGL